MKRNITTWLFIVISTLVVTAQSFAPQVGFDGNTAIHKDNANFIDWANTVAITRGYKNIAIPSNGYVDYGVNSNAIGQANLSVVSLGDGGEAVISFNYSIRNGVGADFAIFENGFLEEQGSELAFLELAFVEVSTDGVDYVRFPTTSENSIDTQIASFGFMNARYIHNFAGKYIQDYGTPFDLSELIPLINGTTVDLNNINYIKIIDVIGTTDTNYATYDSDNHIINDPYPSSFSSGGFDLNAIGVIHNSLTNSVINNRTINVKIYPNPTNEFIHVSTSLEIKKMEIYSIQGKLLIVENNNKINISFLSKGVYFIWISTSKGIVKSKFIKE